MEGQSELSACSARFEETFRQNYDELLRFAARRVGEDQARDVVAETMLVAWRRRDVGKQNERAWLYGVARNVMANLERSAARQAQLSNKLSMSAEPAEIDQTRRLAEQSVVAAVLNTLSTEDREALQLVEWDGLSPVEAAAVLGLGRGAFRVRLHRARSRFRTGYLAAADDDPDASVTAPELTEDRSVR